MIRTPFYLLILKKYEVLISSVVVIAVTIVLILTLLIPNISKAFQIYDNEKQLRSRLVGLSKKNQDLTGLDATYYQSALGKLYSVLPYQKDYVSLFDRFDQLQSRTGVTILRTDFQLGVISTNSATLAKQATKGAFLIPMSVEIAGTQEQVEKFMDSLTDLNGRIVTISNISWQQKNTGLLQVLISGNAYFSLLPTTIGNIDSPLAVLDKNKKDILGKVSQTESTQTISSEDTTPVQVGKQNLFQ